MSFLVSLLFMGFSFATPEVVFSGEIHGTGQPCSISVEVQNLEYDMYTVIYKIDGQTLNFYNETLLPQEKINVEGLFQLEDGKMTSIIGAPIFAAGRYYEVSVVELPDGSFKIRTLGKLVALINVGTFSDKTVICR